MEYILDTNIYIDMQQSGVGYKNLYLTDISIYEMLKHKPNGEKESTYNNIINFVRANEMYITSINGRFRKTLGFKYKNIQKRINKLCLSIYKDMMRNYTTLISAIIEIIYLKLNGIVIEGDSFVTEQNIEKEKVSMFLNVLSKSTYRFVNNHLHKFCKLTLKDENNINTARLEVTLLNIFRNNFEKHMKNAGANIKIVNNFNFAELVKNNNLSFTIEEIKNYITKLITISNNGGTSYEIYTAYACEVLIRGGKLEYNDIVDMNLISIAVSKKCILLTKESKIIRVLKDYEKAIGIEPKLSLRIFKIKSLNDLADLPR